AGMEVVRRFQGRAFFDLTGIQWAFYDAFGVLPADTVKAIGGSQPVIPVPPENCGLAAAVEDLELLRQSAICPRECIELPTQPSSHRLERPFAHRPAA